MDRTVKLLAAIMIASIIAGSDGISAAEIDYIKSVCTKCHGAKGIAEVKITPNLAGQREKYLANQLRDFRTSATVPRTLRENLTDIGGKRRHPVMSTIAARLSNDLIDELSKYYSLLPCRTKRSIKNAKSIAKVSVCSSCHDENGTSHEPWVPKLSGQNKLYLINQLYALQLSSNNKFANTNSIRSHPIMGDNVKNLSQTEIDNLAGYFASRSCR